MTYTYGTKGSPAVGKGLGGLPRREEAVAEAAVEANPYAPLGPNHAYFAGYPDQFNFRGGMYSNQAAATVCKPWYYYPYQDNCMTVTKPQSDGDSWSSYAVQHTMGGQNTTYVAQDHDAMRLGKFQNTDLRHCSYFFRNQLGNEGNVFGHIGPDQTFAYSSNTNLGLFTGGDASTAVEEDFKRMWMLNCDTNVGGTAPNVSTNLAMMTMAGSAEEESSFTQRLYKGSAGIPATHFQTVVASENYITLIYGHVGFEPTYLYASMFHRPADGADTGASFDLVHYKTLLLPFTEMKRGYAHTVTPDNMGRVWITNSADENTNDAGVVVFNPEEEYFVRFRKAGSFRAATVIATENHVFLTWSGVSGETPVMSVVQEDTPGNFVLWKYWESGDVEFTPQPWGKAYWNSKTTGWGTGIWAPAVVNSNGRHFGAFAWTNGYYKAKENTSSSLDTKMYWINADMIVDGKNIREDDPRYAVMPMYLTRDKEEATYYITKAVDSAHPQGIATLTMTYQPADMTVYWNRNRVATEGYEALNWNT